MNIVKFLNANAGVIQLLFSAMVAGATVVYAVLTWRLVSETVRMRKAQTDAKVTMSIRPMTGHIHFVELSVKNDGVGPAYDVDLAIRMEPGSEGDQRVLDFIGKLGFVQRGIPYMSAGQEISTFLASILEDFELKMATALRADVTYRTAAGEHMSDSYLLDFSVFRGITYVGDPPLESLADSLKDLKKDIHDLASGWHKLEVVVQDIEAVRAEKREWHAQMVETMEMDRLAKAQGVGDEA
jgi:hypothetical protein